MAGSGAHWADPMVRSKAQVPSQISRWKEPLLNAAIFVAAVELGGAICPGCPERANVLVDDGAVARDRLPHAVFNGFAADVLTVRLEKMEGAEHGRARPVTALGQGQKRKLRPRQARG